MDGRGIPRVAALLFAVGVLGATAACGGQSAGGPGGRTEGPTMTASEGPGSAATPVPAAGDRLTVVVDDGTGAQTTWTLECDAENAVGGDHPDVPGACAAIATQAAAFAPVPPDRICTMIYGGPQTATVTGTWAGESIAASFRRTDGCEIARWNRMAALLQPGVPVSATSGGI